MTNYDMSQHPAPPIFFKSKIGSKMINYYITPQPAPPIFFKK